MAPIVKGISPRVENGNCHLGQVAICARIGQFKLKLNKWVILYSKPPASDFQAKCYASNAHTLALNKTLQQMR